MSGFLDTKECTEPTDHCFLSTIYYSINAVRVYYLGYFNRLQMSSSNTTPAEY